MILITAREWSQDYEWFVHQPIALKAGISKDLSDATLDRAEQRFGKKGVVDMVGISGYDTSLAMQLNTARYQFSGEGPRLSRFPK